MLKKKTKIVCTLGPSSDSVSEITRLIQSGMNVARLNFSHGSHKHHLQIIKNLHTAEKKTKQRVAILQDLQGPKIRLGEIEGDGIKLKKSEEFELTAKKLIGKRTEKGIIVSVQYKELIKDLKKGDLVLINDGLIEAKVVRKTKDSAICKSIVPGVLESHKGIASPTASFSVPAITKKDREDLKFGLKNKVDFVALSFVKSEKDIQELRALIKKYRGHAKIIAKIERHEAVSRLKEITKEADGLMVARGDLGIDIPAEQVPIVQKRMISLANRHAKPVITATQVLQSMTTAPRATRAEISDAANAVFDNTDAIMLSNESAVGRFPFRAAKTLSRVAMAVEKEMQTRPELLGPIQAYHNYHSTNATCQNACKLSKDTKSKYLIVYTEDGYTARQVAKNRIYTEIISITPDEKVSRELTLTWGLKQIYTKKFKQKGTDKTAKIVEYLKQQKLLKRSDKIVIICNASSKEKLISTIKI